MAESKAHRALKYRVSGWLRSRAWVAVGDEVSIAAGGFRADVAGWTDRRLGPGGVPLRSAVRTILIECKVTAADFRRDSGAAGALLGRRAAIMKELDAFDVPRGPRRRSRPARAPSLFDVRGTALDDMPARIRRLQIELVAIERRLAGRSKFAKMAWWHVADQLYVAAPVGLLRERDIPQGWGLLEATASGGVAVRRKAPILSPRARDHDRILRGIAVSGTRTRWHGACQQAFAWGEEPVGEKDGRTGAGGGAPVFSHVAGR